MERAAHPLRFTEHEVLYLERLLTPSEDFLPDKVPSPSRSTCLKVGSALLDISRGAVEVELNLTQSELWVIRERALATDRLGPDPKFGLSFKCKIYEALLALTTQAVLDDAGLPVAAEDEIREEELRDAYRAWKDNAGQDDSGTDAHAAA